jgi:folate-binding protein YgfZ
MAAILQPAAELPAAFDALDRATELSALLSGVGFATLDQTGWIRVTGADRVRWLNGMVTNAIQDLAPGEGCYNFVLNAQGRIQGDLTAFAQTDELLLETDLHRLPALIATLDHFIIMDDVELAPFTNEGLPVSHQNHERDGLLVAGPQAETMLQSIGISTEQSSELTLQSITWEGNPLDLVHAHSPLVPRFEVWSDLTTILQIDRALTAVGATSVSSEALEDLRILEGTPRYGTDIRNSETARDLPQETGQTRALNFSKGCYLGQEIVERIRSRGAVHRTFSGFRLDGSLPAAGTILTGPEPGADAKPAGELTSVAAIELPEALSPSGEVQLALGYIRREALADAQARRLPLRYPGGVATPIALPWTFGQPSGRPPG